MSLGSPARSVGAALVALVLLASPAHADWLFTPFVGVSFSTSTTFLLPDARITEDRKFFWGGSATWLGDGFLGVEGEFAYAPNFYRSRSEIELTSGPGLTANTQPVTNALSSRVMTVMGSVLVTVPVSITRDSLRPYFVWGFGVIDSSATSVDSALSLDEEGRTGLFDIDEATKATNIGGGAIGMLGRRTGLRFDLRRFRTVGDTVHPVTGQPGLPRLSFWRASVGVIVRY